MKNKREFIIAGISLLTGIAATYFLMQSHIPINKQIVKSPKLQAEQSTPKSNTLSPSLKVAIDLIKQKGYTVIDTSEVWYDPSEQLNVLIGMCTGSADGYCKQAFFFYNGKYLGTDTADPSQQISVVWRNDTTIALNYILYRKDDAMCCPTAGAATVRFQWNGTKLEALDPIPSSDWSADAHR